MDRRTEDKIDRIVEDISDINITLTKQSVILEEHIRRTNLLELKLAPIEKHVVMINGVLKFFGGVAILIAMVEGIFHILGV